MDQYRDRLSLHGEGTCRFSGKERPRLFQHARVRVHHTGGSLGHDARRGVGRVAHRRVRRPPRRSDLGGEDVSTIHAQLHRQRSPSIDHATQRSEHATFVVLARERHARSEEELAAVAVEVGREESDTLRDECLFEHRQRVVQCLGHHIRSLGRQHHVGAREPSEANGCHLVLGLGHGRVEMLAESNRQERAQSRPGDLGRGRRLALRRMGETPLQLVEAFWTRLGRAGRKPLRRALGDQDLASDRRMLRLSRGRRRGTEHQKLARGSPDEEEVDGAGVDAHRHRQAKPTHRCRHLGGLAQCLTHVDGGSARAHRMVVAAEGEQQRVATELEQLTTAEGCLIEHRAEDAVERLDELLRADATATSQLLRERGETRDVGEHEGRVDPLPRTIRRVVVPLERDTRHMPPEVHRGRRGRAPVVRARARTRGLADNEQLVVSVDRRHQRLPPDGPHQRRRN